MTTRTWLRFFTFLLPLTMLALSTLQSAEAGGSRHPYFNDRGTLQWYHSFADVKRAAQAEQKLIFIEYGRRACSNCRKIAQSVLPHSTVRPRLSRLAIGLAADCDRPEGAVAQLFYSNLRNTRMLPFCGFVTPRGRWITGWAGYASPSQMQRYLAQAEARHAAIFGQGAGDRARTLREPSRRAPAQPSTAARRPAAATPEPAPAPAADEEPGYSDADLEEAETAADPCHGGNCEPGNTAPGGLCEGGSCTPPDACCPGGNCTPPSFGERVITGVKNLFGKGGSCCPPSPCSPCAPGAEAPAAATPVPAPGVPTPVPAPATEVARRYGAPTDCLDFPEPAPRIEAPERHLADRNTAWPRPVRPDAEVPVASAMPYGDPDGEALPPPVVRSADQLLAETAAKRGDWATVIRLTRGASIDQSALRTLNRRAHAWAHGRLAYAVRAVHAERYEEARKAMEEVDRTMRGEPEAEDARRGMDAIVRMHDIVVLAEDSPLRSTLRKTAYEKMRGTRWAPLFSEVPMPSPAISSK